ncbi:MAG TPA: tetratricopeptide repeat protein [Terriglobales bacterium]|nr:tetratricopeptide repeat protein [Terriglobales bacterium]
MATVHGSNQSTNSGWTSTQAYVFAIICLLIGVLAGYFLRGSGTSAQAPVATATGAPAGMTEGQQPTPEQMRRMAEKQAEPLLAQLKSNPNNPALLAQIGNVYYDTQQFKDAIEYYDRSLKADPKNPNVRTDMGTAFFYLGDADRAISEFEKTLTYDAKHGQTMFNLGMVKWQGKGDAKGAVETWERLLKEVPDYPDRANVEQLIARAKQHSNIKPGTKTEKPANM